MLLALAGVRPVKSAAQAVIYPKRDKSAQKANELLTKTASSLCFGPTANDGQLIIQFRHHRG